MRVPAAVALGNVLLDLSCNTVAATSATVEDLSLAPWSAVHALSSRECAAAICEASCFRASFTGLAAVCSSSSCCTCAFCHKGRAAEWTAPSGLKVESMHTPVIWTESAFAFAYNPLDLELLELRTTLMVEPLLTVMWVKHLQPCCSKGGLIIDVGAQYGWYTLLARAMGCKTMSFEPVSAFRDVLNLGLQLNNGFSGNASVYPNVVFDTPGNYTVLAPVSGPARPSSGSVTATATTATHERSLLGMAATLDPNGMRGIFNVSKLVPGTIFQGETAEAIAIDAVVRDDAPNVCMLKVDVAGSEPNVMRSARRTLSFRVVDAMQLRVVPKRGLVQECANLRMLRDALLLGFDLYGVPANSGCNEDEYCDPKHWQQSGTLSTLLMSSRNVRYGRGMRKRQALQRARRAAQLAQRVLDKLSRMRGFDPHGVFALRDYGYVPNELLPDYDEIGCHPAEFDDDELVPTMDGFYS